MIKNFIRTFSVNHRSISMVFPVNAGEYMKRMCSMSYVVLLCMVLCPARCNYDFGPAKPDEISLNVSSVTLVAGCTYMFTPAITVPYDVVTWESSNQSVVSITGDGIMTVSGIGTATIRAKITSNGVEYSDECVCTVKDGISIPFIIQMDGPAITIVRYTGPDHEVLIPMTINGFPVTVIANEAFNTCYGITGISIPAGIITIGDLAFDNCARLKVVSIPVSVSTIGYWAFRGCSSLESVSIPSGVTRIGDCAFRGCSSLGSVLISPGVTIIGDNAFEGCLELRNILIPSSVTAIGRLAFRGCMHLKAIQVDESNGSYKDIDGVLFNKTGTELFIFPEGRIESYEVPDGVSEIGDYSFGFCRRLNSVSIPDSVTGIGNYAFYRCYGLLSVKMQSVLPPVLGDSSFELINTNMIIYVPSASVDKYKQSWPSLSGKITGY